MSRRPGIPLLSLNNKKPNFTTRELTELADLLSDSDDWDEDIKSSQTVKANLASHATNVSTSNITPNKPFPQIRSHKTIRPFYSQASTPNKSINHELNNNLNNMPNMMDSDELCRLLMSDNSSKDTSSLNNIKVKDEIKSNIINLGQSSPLVKKFIVPKELKTQFPNKDYEFNKPSPEDIKTNAINNSAFKNPLNSNTMLQIKDESLKSEAEKINVSLDESSLEILNEQHHVQYSNKFTLATQAPTLTDLDNKENSLHLPPNTKIKIPIRLSVEQENIIELAEKGYNIFYTGSAGTGKSVLLKQMIKRLKSIYGPESVAITASTGLAACNIGGFTIHSFAGIGLGKGDADALYKRVRRSRKHLRRWESISALVVDEISMLDAELIDKLDHIAQKIRKNRAPFGGIQLVFCGDFFQLPPVSKDPKNPTKFAFESNAWKNSIHMTIMLQRVFRQQGDLKFIEMLNKMRLGKIDEETEREFKKLNRELPDDDIIPAELYSTRSEVDRANGSRLVKLPGKIHKFRAIDGGDLKDQEMRDKLLQNFLAPKELQLKIGAQVMMIKNMDSKLVNGSLGKVIDFIDADTYLFYDIMANRPNCSVDDLESLRRDPERLTELREAEEMDDDEGAGKKRNILTKEAFSRSSIATDNTPLGESIFDFLKENKGQNQEVQENIKRKREWLRELHETSQGRKLPLVRFKMADLTTRTVLVEPEDWAIEDETEKPVVSRVQLPLMLAWSLSIHKSQGQTLSKVKVDLRRVFEKGQAYVALSRAVSRDGLQVLNFDKTRIAAHEKVVEFYLTLMSADTALEKINKGPPIQRKLNFAPNKYDSENKANTKRRSKTPPVNGQNKIAVLLERRKNRSKY